MCGEGGGETCPYCSNFDGAPGELIWLNQSFLIQLPCINRILKTVLQHHSCRRKLRKKLVVSVGCSCLWPKGKSFNEEKIVGKVIAV